MRIFVIGNLASGKSTLGKALAKRLGLPFLSLDDFRLAHASDKPHQSERAAKKAYFNAIRTTPSFVSEIVPYGGTYMNVKSIVAKSFQIKMLCDVDVCYQNYQNRDEIVPLPFYLNTLESIVQIHANLKNIKADVNVYYPFRPHLTALKLAEYVTKKESSLQ